MTLSNFDWTDKNSVRWFILLPNGHEGPYSLGQLLILKDQKKFASDVKVWSEGMIGPVLLKIAIDRSNVPRPIHLLADQELEPQPPDLPPVPQDEIPPIPFVASEDHETVLPKKTKKSLHVPWPVFLLPVLIFISFFGLEFLIDKNAIVSVPRRPKMDPELHMRIERENTFDLWHKKIFFKEYVPQDHSYIWLVTASFQDCDVEASFTSIKDKLLALNNEKVSFITSGKLSQHLVEFSNFEFIEGSKIIPGMYEMDIKATQCEWIGALTKIKNIFHPVESKYAARTKVILFSKGPDEFNKTLSNLLLKKEEIKEREKNQNDIFWEDLQQKLETLLAISLQIEQHMLDFLDGSPAQFKKNTKIMVDTYTKKFGSFLTDFVVENDRYFKDLSPPQSGSSKIRNYELIVRLSAKKIGLESMKFIEDFLNLKKNPTKSDLKKYQDRIKKVFSTIKQEMNQKLQEVAKDRSS